MCERDSVSHMFPCVPLPDFFGCWNFSHFVHEIQARLTTVRGMRVAGRGIHAGARRADPVHISPSAIFTKQRVFFAWMREPSRHLQ
jgi:hypothetical protein